MTFKILAPAQKVLDWKGKKKVADQQIQGREFWGQGSLKLRRAQSDTGCRWLLTQCVVGGREGGRTADKEIFEENVNSQSQAGIRMKNGKCLETYLGGKARRSLG